MADDKPASPFTIDTARLDLEWARQPKLSRDAGVDEADARHAYNQAKARLAVVEARMALEIRRNYEKYDFDKKPTKDEAKAAVVLCPEYQEAEAAVNLAKRDLDYAEAYKVAITHDRRKALENYVELLALNYVCEREPKPLSPNAQRFISRRERREAITGIDPDE